jgi:glutathione synthase/RimK-type ligase-like ATP-grasp enzyme
LAARVDWRLGDVGRLPHAAVELPAEVGDRCLELTASYGLRFAAIDLAETPDGQYVFFEINPNGQWAWVEQACGLPLASHLADELLGVVS